jgi:hypothetical protein
VSGSGMTMAPSRATSVTKEPPHRLVPEDGS